MTRAEDYLRHARRAAARVDRPLGPVHDPIHFASSTSTIKIAPVTIATTRSDLPRGDAQAAQPL